MTKQRSVKALSWLNFFLADVRDGLGPYLGIYLLIVHDWSAASIGLVLGALTIASLLSQAPAGAIIDSFRAKRAIIATAAVVVGVSCVAITLFPSLYPVLVFQSITGLATSFFAPAIAGLTLGLVGRAMFSTQVGVNESFNHAGNVVTAVLAGVVSWYISFEAYFYSIFSIALVSCYVVFQITPTLIDHNVARGLDDGVENTKTPTPLLKVFSSKHLFIFILCITLFHFSNAAMLPLLGQELALGNEKASFIFMSACIILAQLVMIPMAIIVGRKADSWGRKILFLIAFAALPLRGFLFTLSENAYFLVSLQIFDGVGAGIFGALFFIVVADLTKGTGHYNIALGVAATIMALGVTLSNVLAGWIATEFGYPTAFTFLGGIGLFGLLLYLFAMPETKNYRRP